jgi:hypothetical protein
VDAGGGDPPGLARGDPQIWIDAPGPAPEGLLLTAQEQVKDVSAPEAVLGVD